MDTTAMDAESRELLREWLVRSLEPVCDADPEVLSKYVLALIQNDPKREGLRDTCCAKLDEFLGDETAPFVARLFKAIETQSYRSGNGEGASESAATSSSGHTSTHNTNSHHQHRPHDPSQSRTQSHHAPAAASSRRRGRGAVDDPHGDLRDDGDEEEHRRFQKRRREEDREGHRRFAGGGAPAGYGGGGGGGGRGGRGDWDPRGGGGNQRNGYPMDRRRQFPTEWGMPPPQGGAGMWPPHYPPPHGGGGGGGAAGGFPPPHLHPEFDPNGFNPEAAGMHGAPPHGHHPRMMMPRHMGGGPFYPPYAGGGGGGGRGGGRGGPGGAGGGAGGGGRGRGFHGNRVLGGTPTGEDGADGSGHAHPSTGQPVGARTTLRVSNVDVKYVNMTKLSLHFSKFGNVVNVQMRPAHRCAYVQYASEDEAKKAFHSPIPVCNNRFIEVKWAKYDAKDPQGAPTEEKETAKKKEEDGATTAEGGDATTSSGPDHQTTGEGEGVDSEKTPEELRAAALEKGRQVLEAKRELLEKQRALMKQKEELLKRQLAQQKELLERMSQQGTTVSSADKRDLLNKITALSEELRALQPKRVGATTSSLASETAASKLSGLKAELSALEAQTAGPGGRGGRWGGANGHHHHGGRGGGGGGYYRGGRGGGLGGGRGYASNTLDNRTTIVKVANLPEEARDASVLEQHFGNFGAIERVVVDATVPDQGFIKFHDRYAGQNAVARGGLYGDTQLQLSWVEAQDAPAALTPSTSGEGEAVTESVATNSEGKEVSASA